MAFDNERKIHLTATQADAAQIDMGLRAYMMQVYNYMTGALAITGLVAYFSANTPAVLNLLYAVGPDGQVAPTMLAYVAMFSPLAFILVLSFGINKLSPAATQGVFWTFAAVMGLSLSHIFLVYTGVSIVRVFFITSAAFAGLSLFGYTTKKDLSGFGSFLIMGLFGIIIAGLVNIFLQSSMLHFVTSVLGVLIFAGLTAYDTQRIKEMYWEGDGAGAQTKKAVMGALSLYLDFINLFMLLLHFLGNRE